MTDIEHNLRPQGHALTWKTLTYVWLAVFFVFGLLTIKTYPPVNYNLGDEIGFWRQSLDALENRKSTQIIVPRLYLSSMGRYLSLTGGGLFAARSFSLLAATLALYMTCLLGRELTDERGGLLSSLLLGTTFAFAWHSRVIRPEALTTLFIISAFYLLYIARRSDKELYALLSGLLATLSVGVHPNNLQYALGFLLFYPMLFWKDLLSKRTAYFAGGMSLGFVFWVFAVYMPAMPEAAGIGAVKDMASVTGAFPATGKNFFAFFWKSLVSLPGDYLQYLRMFDVFFPNRIYVAVPAVAACAVWAGAMFTKKRREVLLLLFFVLLTSFINYFVAPQYGYWHMVEFYPFFAVAAVLGLYGLGEKFAGRGRAVLLWIAVSFFVFVGAADTVATMYGMRGYDYQRILKRVSAKVDGKVLAGDMYSPAFDREDFVQVWFSIDRPNSNCPPFSSRVRQLGIKYIIADGVFFTFGRKGCGEYYQRKMTRYLRSKCTLMEVVPETYPNYWAPGGFVQGIYIYRTPE